MLRQLVRQSADRLFRFAAAIWVFMVPRLALTLRTVGVNKSRSRMAASMTLLATLFHLPFFSAAPLVPPCKLLYYIRSTRQKDG